MSYKFREDIAIADVAFELSDKTLEELFKSAALATTATMVKNLKTITLSEKRELSVQNKEVDRLLHDFLQELIFYKDAQLLLFGDYSIKIKKTSSGYLLKATCRGEKLDMQKHELLVDVKAVSWHMFRVEEVNNKWEGFVILDV